MKGIILVIAAVIAVAIAVIDVDKDTASRVSFEAFKTNFKRSYASVDENEHRFRIFKSNLEKNDRLRKENPRATFGINKFSDLSTEEFAAKYLMNVDFKEYVAPPPKDFTKTHASLAGCTPNPTNFDWTSCGVTTAIYNQGQCGSCWAFSATETIESYHVISGHSLTGLAMEQIVDCDTQGEDQGCGGGFPTGAYEYVQGAGGIEALADYPYTAEGGESGSCNFDASDIVCTVSNYNSINGETGLYQQMSSSQGGPVSVCVDASSWSSYTGGVLSSCGDSVDHCVQAVGYANYGESGAYWIVRNSWGEDWGEQGYIWVAIGQDLCAIGDYATVVTAN